jgi:ATP-dependent Clp protease ATP-binding subunit ClpC
LVEAGVFERFTDEARRSLFFARHKTTERNGYAISDEDLLHGISLASAAAIELLGDRAAAAFRSAESGEQYWSRIQHDREVSIRGRKEIPLSQDAMCVLQFATAEADALLHKDIGAEHLLLGLLRDEATDAWRRLNEAGARLSDVRSRVKARREGGPAT